MEFQAESGCARGEGGLKIDIRLSPDLTCFHHCSIVNDVTFSGDLSLGMDFQRDLNWPIITQPILLTCV